MFLIAAAAFLNARKAKERTHPKVFIVQGAALPFRHRSWRPLEWGNRVFDHQLRPSQNTWHPGTPPPPPPSQTDSLPHIRSTDKICSQPHFRDPVWEKKGFQCVVPWWQCALPHRRRTHVPTVKFCYHWCWFRFLLHSTVQETFL